MSRILLTIVSIVVVSFLVIYIGDFFETKSNDNKLINAADRQYEEIEREAEKFGSEILKSVAMQETARSLSKKKIETQGDLSEKKRTALEIFVGYYLVNTRTRIDYCSRFDVDLSDFSERFREINKNEFDLAESSAFGGPSGVEKIYRLLEPKAEEAIDQFFQDMAKEYATTPAGACEIFAENSFRLAEEMSFSKTHPSVYAAIYN